MTLVTRPTTTSSGRIDVRSRASRTARLSVAAGHASPAVDPPEPVVAPRMPRVVSSPRYAALQGPLSTTTVVASYLLLSGVAFWPSLPRDPSRLYGSGPDPVQALWFLSWEAHALSHGINPFFSGAMLVPTGVNLAQSTSIPLLGFLTSPLIVDLSITNAGNVVELFRLALGSPQRSIDGFDLWVSSTGVL